VESIPTPHRPPPRLLQRLVGLPLSSPHRPLKSLRLAHHPFIAHDLDHNAVRLHGTDCPKATPKAIAYCISWHGFAPIVKERTPIHDKMIS